jgi:hypothetical protein
MAPRARRGRSRTERVLTVLAGLVVLVGLALAGTASTAVGVPVPDAAAATSSATPSATPSAGPTGSASAGPAATPTADPLAAPATSATPAPRPVDPYVQAQTAAQRVTASVQEWASFTLLDRKTGRRIGDPRSYQPTFSESTIKVWLAADLLATRARAGRQLTPYETQRMTAMIRRSDDNAAEVIWRWLGADAAIEDMIRTCGLEDTQVYDDWWSKTAISSRDLARLGDCVVPGKGKFLSPAVGAPLLALMRSVDPTNAFGIQQVYPAGKGVRIAVKNGWTEHGAATGTRWNVNCLGIWGPGNRWVLAVTTRYPVANGLDFGAGVCREVTRAILPLTRTTRPPTVGRPRPSD